MTTRAGQGRPNNTAAMAKRTDFLLSRMGYDPRESVSFRVMSSGIALPSANPSLAADPTAALAMINASPRVSKPLTSEGVHLHAVESSNTSYIADRFAFLSLSTIANMAADSKDGISFMTRHATPGMFHPGENPYGRTFAGLFEQSGDFARSVTQFYMLKGATPNGAGAASTDDLHDGMVGGTLFDFSPGLKRGAASKKLCDVCGEEIFSLKCSHCPGTVYGMTDVEIEKQAARGIPDGLATFTFVDWRGGELSLVCDGAIDGVGTTFSSTRVRKMGTEVNIEVNVNAEDEDDECPCCANDAVLCACPSKDAEAAGECACDSNCTGCVNANCGGLDAAMSSHQEEPMFTPELKASLGLAASATDAEVTAKIQDNATKLATTSAENDSLKLAQKTKADADFAAAWSEKLGAETFAQIKDLPNRDALATAFAAQLAAAAKPGDPVKPPIGDLLKGAGSGAAPVTLQTKTPTEESEIFRRALGKFKTAEEVAKFAMIGPIEAMEKWLSTSGTPVTLSREPLHENFERQTIANRKAMLGA